MRSNDPRVRRPRFRRPVPERLEPRALMALAAPAHPAESPQPSRSAGQQAHIESPNGLLGKRPPGPFLNPKVIQQSANLLYGPTSATPMTPTPREVKRQTITGRWIGQYTIGPPRFSDRASTIHAWSKAGGSNAFLKGTLDLALFPPADPAATPTPGDPYANQVTGVVALFSQNLLQTGGMLVLDLNATPSPGSNPRQLPTHLSWTYDTSASGGPFTTPAGFTQGTGTLEIRWHPDAHPLPGTLGSGTMIVTFQGLYNYNQIASGVSKFYS